VYNYHFPHPANIIDKDSLLIPSGFDSLKQIEALKKGIIGAVGSDGQPLSFEDVIKPPHMLGGKSSKDQAEKQGFVES
jgi:hypothetical protein